MNTFKIRKLFSCSVCLFLSACGGGGGSSEDPYAQQANFSDNPIRVQQSSTLAVVFTYSAERVYGDNDTVHVVVRLPAELSYHNWSSAIDSLGGDVGVVPTIVPCAGVGDTYLVYEFNRTTLINATNPLDETSARLTLRLDGNESANDTETKVAAFGDDYAFDCAQEFNSQQTAELTVR